MADTRGLPSDALRTIPLLRGLGDAELASIAALFTPVNAREGDVLFDVDQPADAMYVLARGDVDLTQPDGESFELHPPCIIGELGALTGLTRNSRAVARAGASLWRTTREALLAFFDRRPDIGLRFEKNLLDICADKIDRDQRRLQDMRQSIIRTQKAMKQMRDLILESADTPISGPLHTILEGLIEKNRRVNYRVRPPAAAAASVRLDDGAHAAVEQISRTHISFRPPGDGPVPGERWSGVLSLGGPEMPVSGRVLRIYRGRIDLELDLLIDDYAAALEGYLTRVQMLDFLV